MTSPRREAQAERGMPAEALATWSAVLRWPGLSDAAKLAWFALFDAAGWRVVERQLEITTGELATACGRSDRRIRERIDALETAGLVQVLYRPQTSAGGIDRGRAGVPWRLVLSDPFEVRVGRRMAADPQRRLPLEIEADEVGDGKTQGRGDAETQGQIVSFREAGRRGPALPEAHGRVDEREANHLSGSAALNKAPPDGTTAAKASTLPAPVVAADPSTVSAHSSPRIPDPRARADGLRDSPGLSCPDKYLDSRTGRSAREECGESVAGSAAVERGVSGGGGPQPLAAVVQQIAARGGDRSELDERVESLAQKLLARVGPELERPMARRIARSVETGVFPRSELRRIVERLERVQREGALRKSAGSYFMSAVCRRAEELGTRLVPQEGAEP